ncbi:MAG: radical SAM protein [Desulfurococcales archaeon ex4484_58]|nr:MAG: radical SAM protein [Desulfurococcales archaeon ex4484_58]
MPKPLVFIPGEFFPSISITGSRCWLMCSYCRGRYLKGMVHIEGPGELYSVAKYYWRRGAYGLLISGGFTREGILPVKPYLPVIRDIKRDFDLIISIHPGLIDRGLIEEIRSVGVDIVDYELVLDNYIIRDLKHLNKTIEDYIKTYEELLENGPPHIVPHIPIGFTRDDRWIYTAINILREYKPEITVFLVSISLDQNQVDRVVEILRYTRKKLYETSLGCMRPYKIKPILDRIVIEEKLIDRIVNPSKKYIKEYKLKVINTCCSIPYTMLKEKNLI